MLQVGVHAHEVLALGLVEAPEHGGGKTALGGPDDDAHVVALVGQAIDLLDGAVLRVVVDEDQLGLLGHLGAHTGEQPGG